MNWRAGLALAAAMTLGAGCETTSPKPDAEPVYRGATFEMRLPPSVTTAVDQGDGFAVHYFRIGASRCQMGLYEGQKPRPFAHKEKDLTVMRRGVTSRDSIPKGEDVWGVDSNALVWRESVWNCTRTVRSADGKSFQIPTVLHLWYFGATEEEGQAFDGMVDTLQMLR